MSEERQQIHLAKEQHINDETGEESESPIKLPSPLQSNFDREDSKNSSKRPNSDQVINEVFVKPSSGVQNKFVSEKRINQSLNREQEPNAPQQSEDPKFVNPNMRKDIYLPPNTPNNPKPVNPASPTDTDLNLANGGLDSLTKLKELQQNRPNFQEVTKSYRSYKSVQKEMAKEKSQQNKLPNLDHIGVPQEFIYLKKDQSLKSLPGQAQIQAARSKEKAAFRSKSRKSGNSSMTASNQQTDYIGRIVNTYLPDSTPQSNQNLTSRSNKQAKNVKTNEEQSFQEFKVQTEDKTVQKANKKLHKLASENHFKSKKIQQNNVKVGGKQQFINVESLDELEEQIAEQIESEQRELKNLSRLLNETIDPPVDVREGQEDKYQQNEADQEQIAFLEQDELGKDIMQAKLIEAQKGDLSCKNQEKDFSGGDKTTKDGGFDQLTKDLKKALLYEDSSSSSDQNLQKRNDLHITDVNQNNTKNEFSSQESNNMKILDESTNSQQKLLDNQNDSSQVILKPEVNISIPQIKQAISDKKDINSEEMREIDDQKVKKLVKLKGENTEKHDTKSGQVELIKAQEIGEKTTQLKRGSSVINHSDVKLNRGFRARADTNIVLKNRISEWNSNQSEDLKFADEVNQSKSENNKMKDPIQDLIETHEKDFSGLEQPFESSADYHQIVPCPWDSTQFLTFQLHMVASKHLDRRMTALDKERQLTLDRTIQREKLKIMEVKESVEDETQSAKSGLMKRKNSYIDTFTVEELLVEREDGKKHYDSENSDFGIVSLWKIDDQNGMVCLKSIPIESPLAIKVHQRDRSKGKLNDKSKYRALFQGNDKDFYIYNVLDLGKKCIGVSRIVYQNDTIAIEMKARIKSQSHIEKGIIEVFKGQSDIRADQGTLRQDQYLVQSMPFLVDEGKIMIYAKYWQDRVSIFAAYLDNQQYDQEILLIKGGIMFLGLDLKQENFFFLTNLQYLQKDQLIENPEHSRMFSPSLICKASFHHIQERKSIDPLIDPCKIWEVLGDSETMDFLRIESQNYPICEPHLQFMSDQNASCTLSFSSSLKFSGKSITFELCDSSEFCGKKFECKNPLDQETEMKVQILDKKTKKVNKTFKVYNRAGHSEMHNQDCSFLDKQGQYRVDSTLIGLNKWISDDESFSFGDSQAFPYESKQMQQQIKKNLSSGNLKSNSLCQFGDLDGQQIKIQNLTITESSTNGLQKESRKISFDFSLINEVYEANIDGSPVRQSDKIIGNFEGLFLDGRTKAKLYGILNTIGTGPNSQLQRLVQLQRESVVKLSTTVDQKGYQQTFQILGPDLMINSEENYPLIVQISKYRAPFSVLIRSVIGTIRDKDILYGAFIQKSIDFEQSNQKNTTTAFSFSLKDLKPQSQNGDNDKKNQGHAAINFDLKKQRHIFDKYEHFCLEDSVLALAQNLLQQKLLLFLSVKSRINSKENFMVVQIDRSTSSQMEQILESEHVFVAESEVKWSLSYPIVGQIGSFPSRRQIILRQLNTIDNKKVALYFANWRVLSFVEHTFPVSLENKFSPMHCHLVILVQSLNDSQEKKLLTISIDPFASTKQTLFDIQNVQAPKKVQSTRLSLNSIMKVKDITSNIRPKNSKTFYVQLINGDLCAPKAVQSYKKVDLLIASDQNSQHSLVYSAQGGNQKVNFHIVYQTDTGLWGSILQNKDQDSKLQNLLEQDLSLAPIYSVRGSQDYNKLFVVVNTSEDLSSILEIRSDFQNKQKLEVQVIYESKDSKIVQMEQHFDLKDSLVVIENNLKVVVLDGKENLMLHKNQFSEVQLEQIITDSVQRGKIEMPWAHFFVNQRAIQIHDLVFSLKGSIKWQVEDQNNCIAPIMTLNSLVRIYRDVRYSQMRFNVRPIVGLNQTCFLPHRISQDVISAFFTADNTIIFSIKQDPFLCKFNQNGQLLIGSNFGDSSLQLTINKLKSSEKQIIQQRSRKKKLQKSFSSFLSSQINTKLTLQQHQNTNSVPVEIEIESQITQDHKYFLALNKQSEIRSLIISQKSSDSLENFLFKGSFDMRNEDEREVTKYLNTAQSCQIFSEKILSNYLSGEISMHKFEEPKCFQKQILLSNSGTVIIINLISVSNFPSEIGQILSNSHPKLESNHNFYQGKSQIIVGFHTKIAQSNEDSIQDSQQEDDENLKDLFTPIQMYILCNSDFFDSLKTQTDFFAVQNQIYFPLNNSIWRFDLDQQCKNKFDWKLVQLTGFNLIDFCDTSPVNIDEDEECKPNDVYIQELEQFSLIRNRLKDPFPKNQTLIQVGNSQNSIALEVSDKAIKEILFVENIQQLNNQMLWVRNGFSVNNPREKKYIRQNTATNLVMFTQQNDSEGDFTTEKRTRIFRTFSEIDLWTLKKVHQGQKMDMLDTESLMMQIDGKSFFTIVEQKPWIFEQVLRTLKIHLIERPKYEYLMAEADLDVYRFRLNQILTRVETTCGRSILQRALEFQKSHLTNLYRIALLSQDITLNDLISTPEQLKSILSLQTELQAQILDCYRQTRRIIAIPKIQFPEDEKQIAILGDSILLSPDQIEEKLAHQISKRDFFSCLWCRTKVVRPKVEVEVKMIPLDWLYGQDSVPNPAQDFLIVVNQSNQTKNFLVKSLFSAFWWQEKVSIILKVQIPVMATMALSIVYTLLFLQMPDEIVPNSNEDRINAALKDVGFDKWISLPFTIFFLGPLILEIIQIFEQPKTYFRQYGNYLDLIVAISNLLITIPPTVQLLTGQEQFSPFWFDKIRTLAAFNQIFIAIQVIRWLRISSQGSYYVDLIISTIMEVGNFMLIMLFMIFAFSSSSYILNKRRKADQLILPGLAYEDQSSYFVLLDYLMFNFQTVLGLADDPNFAEGDKWILYFFYTLETGLVLVIMLNMLISIMGDVFAQQQLEKEENATKQKLKLMEEYIGMFDQKGAPKKWLYLVERVVQAGEKEEWDGQIMAIRKDVQQAALSIQQFILQKVKTPLQRQIDEANEKLVQHQKISAKRFTMMDSQVKRLQFDMTETKGTSSKIRTNLVDVENDQLANILDNLKTMQEEMNKKLNHIAGELEVTQGGLFEQNKKLFSSNEQLTQVNKNMSQVTSSLKKIGF